MIRLLLLGAGHVNLEVLRRTILERPPELAVTIVSLGARHFYSGMTPGFLAGQYGLDDLTSDVPAIARRAGAVCILGEVTGLDPAARRARLADGRELEYDLVSLNLGSLLAGADSEAARDAEIIKPIERAARVKERIEALAAVGGGAPARVVVVGAGASGVEVACAARSALGRGGRPAEVRIVDGGERILRGYSDRFQRRAEEALAELGIAVGLGRSSRPT
jgi:selenide,water dikinase